MMHTVYLGLGSNVGDSVQFLAAAINGIAVMNDTSITDLSDVYQTEPVGDVQQNDFLNMAMAVETALLHTEFHRRIKELEQSIGRKETVRWGPREIDIDLLLFDDIVVSTEHLTIPHREMQNRKFVLQPLSDIAPSAMHPVLGRTIGELNAECTGRYAVRHSRHYTTQLHLLINDSITDQTG